METEFKWVASVHLREYDFSSHENSNTRVTRSVRLLLNGEIVSETSCPFHLNLGSVLGLSNNITVPSNKVLRCYMDTYELLPKVEIHLNYRIRVIGERVVPPAKKPKIALTDLLRKLREDRNKTRNEISE